MAIKKTSPGKDTKKSKVEIPKKISYHRKPDNLTLEEWQVALRRQFGKDNEHEFRIINVGNREFFSDFQVTNALTNNTYKVAIRSADDSLNYCECFDFKTNRLGVCKHISAVMHHLSELKGFKKAMKDGFEPAYTSVYVDYRHGRLIRIRIGAYKKDEFEALAQTYFDADGTLKPASFAVFELFLEKAAALSHTFRCYPDALDFVIAERDKIRRRDYLWRVIPDGENDGYFNNLIKASLFPYQRKGVFFAALAGKSLIADEMGLGKTLQAIATAELYKKELGINRVLVVCPTSLKYQWKAEIERFTDSSVYVVESSLQKRKDRYWRSTDAFYVVVSYHTMTHDLDWLNRMEPDLVILDEAQRIKNWKTKVSQQIKKISTPYAIVLTGTPIENKLEELYSIMQFIDVYRLGPMHHFLNEHQITDESGQIIGYKNLNKIAANLSDVLIRRTKKEVLSELPIRMDKNLLVPMTPQQTKIHNDLGDNVAKLVTRWRKAGFLNETDRKRLILTLNQMRMICDSTFILDQKTRHDTKVDEVMNILDEVLQHSDEKVVVFSQWERMTRLVAEELEKRHVLFEHLHGGIESLKRKELLENFQTNPASRVFLSTDAGGVGLNLQNASLLINLDIPWNPAVLEQRIGRIYRLGQENNVSIINLISAGTIEQRMLDVLQFKGAIAKGVLDGGEDTIFVGEDEFRQFMDSVETLVPEDNQMTEPEEVAENAEENIKYEIADETTASTPHESAAFPGDDDVNQPEPEPAINTSSSKPAHELIQTGIHFLAQLGKTLKDPQATRDMINSITQKDETGRVFLKIEVENEEVINDAVQALGTLFGVFLKQ